MSGHRRVAVTSPQTRLAHARRRYRGPWRPTTLDPAEAPLAVALYRRQRRLAATALGVACALVFGLPLLLAVLPSLDRLRVFDVPVSWLAVMVLPFPAMVGLAFWHLRRVEREEGALDDVGPDEAPR
ncbi:hypothetical protein B1813_21295 [Saccharomonospora piscinae]|uniref:DUF485 domain-containing protein n=1 Tax=Saccharomonospora piscinae TaxID=687388 RepID=A0A1V8ZXR2_SACPI|nr:hypothetical protein [Saccharomonospora piscinae]OQO89474.1 hypothetical protein B1813_21295 [Saccharomonospora piscinae]TLW91163.1 hypothetical protein FFT09_18035 [Saccharomonospora piscinae]